MSLFSILCSFKGMGPLPEHHWRMLEKQRADVKQQAEPKSWKIQANVRVLSPCRSTSIHHAALMPQMSSPSNIIYTLHETKCPQWKGALIASHATIKSLLLNHGTREIIMLLSTLRLKVI